MSERIVNMIFFSFYIRSNENFNINDGGNGCDDDDSNRYNNANVIKRMMLKI